MINLTINGTACSTKEGSTILDAAKEAGIYIPTLCHLKNINEEGLCRMCVVKVAGAPRLQTACNTLAAEGMEVFTEDEEVLESRRITLDLICRNHRMECEYCTRYTDCRLHELLVENGMDDRPYISSYKEGQEDHSSSVLVRDAAKCIQCRRCVAVCAKARINAIGVLGRGENTVIGTDIPMSESGCVECGTCVAVCPTGALSVRSDVQKLWNLIRVDKKHMIAVVSPDIPQPLGQYLHEESCADGRLSAFLRMMGFERVYQLSGEKKEVSGGKISAACPSTVRFIKERYPQFVSMLDDSPCEEKRAGEYARSAYCAETGTAPEKTAAVLITSCIARKDENDGYDVVLTPRELVSFMNQGCVSKFTMLKLWKTLTPEPFDPFKDKNGNEIPVTGGMKAGEDGLSEAFGLEALDKILSSIGENEKPEIPLLYACSSGCGTKAQMLLGLGK